MKKICGNCCHLNLKKSCCVWDADKIMELFEDDLRNYSCINYKEIGLRCTDCIDYNNFDE